jgi:CRP-like cAMP-binding protein
MTKSAKRSRSESISSVEWLKYHSHLGAFSHLPPSARQEARLIDLPARSTVFASGDVAEEMFFILSGEVRLFRRSRSGDPIVLGRRDHGFLAEHALYLLIGVGSRRRSAS